MHSDPSLPDLRVFDGPEWDAAIVKLALETHGIEAVLDTTETIGSRHLHGTVFIRSPVHLERARRIVAEHVAGQP
jgi:hypothetical protein